jgi:hypothetical protein
MGFTLNHINIQQKGDTMRHTIIWVVSLVLLSSIPAIGQGFYFGLKGGPTIGFQQWEQIERDPLYKYHAAAFIESYDEEDRYSLFVQLGYHIKGSAIRNRNFFNRLTGNVIRPPAQEFLFRNLSLILGGKQKFEVGTTSKVFYQLGLRGDYTLSTNLDVYQRFNEANPAYAIYPFDDKQFINTFNYGVSVGGGIQFELSELVGTVVELTVNPDFSNQYEQPEIPNVTDPYTGQLRTLRERRIRNLTVELSVGFRFLRKVVYID